MNVLVRVDDQREVQLYQSFLFFYFFKKMFFFNVCHYCQRKSKNASRKKQVDRQWSCLNGSGIKKNNNLSSQTELRVRKLDKLTQSV